jgi:hypothetical protein
MTSRHNGNQPRQPVATTASEPSFRVDLLQLTRTPVLCPPVWFQLFAADDEAD